MKSYPLTFLLALGVTFVTTVTISASSTSGSAPEVVQGRLLDNGVEYFWLPGGVEATLTLAMGVGTADDPPGQGGLAEVTAQALLGGTPRHTREGAVLAALGGVAKSVHTAVSREQSVIVLEGVSDVGAALTLMVEVFSQSSLPYTAVMQARTELAEQLVAGGQTAAMVSEAQDLLSSGPSTMLDPFALLSIEQADARAFHQKKYRPSRFRVVQQGGSSFADMAPSLETILGTWAVSRAESSRPPRGPATEGGTACSALLGASAPRLAVAFQVRGEPAAAAAALRLAFPSEHWSLRSAALTTAGDLAAPGGSLVVVSPEGGDLSSYLALLSGLEGLKARGARRKDIQNVGIERAGDGEEAGLAFLETVGLLEGEALSSRPVVDALGELRRRDLKKAAAGLLEERRSVLISSDSLDAGWASHCASLEERAAGTLRDDIARTREAKARRIVARTLRAHGGEAFLAADKVTMIGRHDTLALGDVRQAARTRLDADYEKMVIRQETRHESVRAGTYLVNYGPGICRAKGPKGVWLDFPTLPTMTYRNTFRRHPLPLLRDANATGSFLQLLGPAKVKGRPVERVIVADPEVGLTRLFIDSDSGLLIQVEYRNRFPYQSTPIDVTIHYSDHLEVRGALLHGTETVGGPGSELASRITEIQWTVRGEGFSPLDALPHADDLGASQSTGMAAPQTAPAER